MNNNYKEKARWKTLDTYGIWHRGKVPALMGCDWACLETMVFERVEQFESVWLGIRFESSSGAGWLREYEKKGLLWVRVRETSFLPRSNAVSLLVYKFVFIPLFIFIVLTFLVILAFMLV